MLTIWGRLNSHNVKKVVWLAEELNLAYRRIDVGGAFGMDAAYLALNPNALIPTIEDGDLTLWESNAILRYLAAQHGGDAWHPASPALRARADRWMDWQFSYADAQRDAFLNCVRRSEDQRDHAAIARSVEKCATLLAILDRHLGETPWLSGETIGLGDIPMGVYIYTWFTLPIERPDFPHIAAWYDRLRVRPGFAAQVAIPLT